jgi:hypothetical protein
MLTRDEVIQLILYLIVATALLLASRARAETVHRDGGRQTAPHIGTFAVRAVPEIIDVNGNSIDRIKLLPILRPKGATRRNARMA